MWEEKNKNNFRNVKTKKYITHVCMRNEIEIKFYKYENIILRHIKERNHKKYFWRCAVLETGMSNRFYKIPCIVEDKSTVFFFKFPVYYYYSCILLFYM